MISRHLNTGLKLTVVILLVIIAYSCSRENNDTGYAFMPDMAYSHASETGTENEVFANGRTNQLPVEGTIPREMIPYQYAKTFDDQKRAGLELVNPIETSKENLTRGKEQYDIYCLMCHGESGKSDGHLVKSKLFPVQPISLSGDYVKTKPDGEIYHVITMGSLSGLMGAHGSQISQEDRWRIVMYIKNGFKN